MKDLSSCTRELPIRGDNTDLGRAVATHFKAAPCDQWGLGRTCYFYFVYVCPCPFIWFIVVIRSCSYKFLSICANAITITS